MAGNERQKERMWAAVGPVLEPGERAIAGAMVQTGPSQWWALLTWIITAIATKHWYFVVTDRRVIIVPATKRPQGISWAGPLGSVSIQEHTVGKVWSSFVLRGSDGSTGKYRYLQRFWAPDIAQIIQSLGGAAQPQAYQPQAGQPLQQASFQPPPQQGGFTG